MVNKYYPKKNKENISEGEKEKSEKKAHDRYKNLSEEEKEKKPQYDLDRNKNLSEEEIQKKVEYIRNY